VSSFTLFLTIELDPNKTENQHIFELTNLKTKNKEKWENTVRNSKNRRHLTTPLALTKCDNR
jgi:hypothetical protein